jgi:hypothetical protein
LSPWRNGADGASTYQRGAALRTDFGTHQVSINELAAVQTENRGWFVLFHRFSAGDRALTGQAMLT